MRNWMARETGSNLRETASDRSSPSERRPLGEAVGEAARIHAMDENDDIGETVKELLRRSDELRQQAVALARASELIRRDVEALRVRARTVTPRPSDEHPIPSA